MLHTYAAAGAVTVGAYLAGLPWGPLGMVMALAVTSLVIRLPILCYLAGRRGPVRTSDLWKGFLSHLPCWAGAYAAASLTHTMVTQASPLVQILVCAPFGLAAGVGVGLALERPRANAFYAWNTIRSLLVSHSSDAVAS